MVGEKRLFSMSGIKQNHGRFLDIVKGKIRQNLKEFVSHGEMIGRKGNDRVSIPVPQIDLPHFTFGTRQRGGVSQGDGKVGDKVGKGDPKEGPGQGEAGNIAGEHGLEVDLSLEELAQMLGEELQLPNIQPKGSRDISSKSHRYTDIRQVGPQSLRHFKRTYREALKRQIASGIYDPKNPRIIPIKADMRFRSWAESPVPQTNAVIFYMMDVSGSMGDEQKEIVRTTAFWIDTWLKHQYKGVQRRFIIHDASAKEVDESTFFKTRENGGTLISTAYKLALQMIKEEYPVNDWNIYLFHFSDGDNWSNEDTKLCLDLLTSEILPVSNQFAYGQVESRYGSGQFFKDILERFGNDEKVVANRIAGKGDIYEAIKKFFGAGR
jgi:sporulation protein YhbH